MDRVSGRTSSPGYIWLFPNAPEHRREPGTERHEYGHENNRDEAGQVIRLRPQKLSWTLTISVLNITGSRTCLSVSTALEASKSDIRSHGDGEQASGRQRVLFSITTLNGADMPR